MDTSQLQSDKLNIINWITEIQDYSIVEKIKAIMGSDTKPYKLTDQQQQVLDSQVGLDSSLYVDADKLVSDIKAKFEFSETDKTSNSKPYILSEEQQQILNERLMEDLSNFVPARELLSQLRKKHGL